MACTYEWSLNCLSQALNLNECSTDEHTQCMHAITVHSFTLNHLKELLASSFCLGLAEAQQKDIKAECTFLHGRARVCVHM